MTTQTTPAEGTKHDLGMAEEFEADAVAAVAKEQADAKARKAEAERGALGALLEDHGFRPPQNRLVALSMFNGSGSNSNKPGLAYGRRDVPAECDEDGFPLTVRFDGDTELFAGGYDGSLLGGWSIRIASIGTETAVIAGFLQEEEAVMIPVRDTSGAAIYRVGSGDDATTTTNPFVEGAEPLLQPKLSQRTGQPVMAREWGLVVRPSVQDDEPGLEEAYEVAASIAKGLKKLMVDALAEGGQIKTANTTVAAATMSSL